MPMEKSVPVVLLTSIFRVSTEKGMFTNKLIDVFLKIYCELKNNFIKISYQIYILVMEEFWVRGESHKLPNTF